MPCKCTYRAHVAHAHACVHYACACTCSACAFTACTLHMHMHANAHSEHVNAYVHIHAQITPPHPLQDEFPRRCIPPLQKLLLQRGMMGGLIIWSIDQKIKNHPTPSSFSSRRKTSWGGCGFWSIDHWLKWSKTTPPRRVFSLEKIIPLRRGRSLINLDQ